MAPEMLLTHEARELRELGAKIRDYQTAKSLTDSAMVRKFSGLGSTKTYSRILQDDLAELDLERQLANYRAVWALIESVGDTTERIEELYEDMTPVAQLRKALFDVMRESGNARFVLVEGDTGLGKSCARRLLIERYGQRILWVEATDVWNDSMGAFLGAVLTALGVREQFAAAEQVLLAIQDRAEAGGDWVSPALTDDEQALLGEMIDLHLFQLSQLSYGEYLKAWRLMTARARSAGGQVLNEPAYHETAH